MALRRTLLQGLSLARLAGDWLYRSVPPQEEGAGVSHAALDGAACPSRN